MPSAVARTLSRLSRQKLIDLCITWSKSSSCDPYLLSNRHIYEFEEEDYLHEPERSRQGLKSLYNEMKHGSPDLDQLSKRDIIDRIVDGDWRRGLSYDQLASIDFAILEENDTAYRWSALKLVPLCSGDEGDVQRPGKRRKIEYTSSATTLSRYPDTTPTTFVQNLKKTISPLVKAHYRVHRMETLQLSVIRIHITPNTPFAPLNVNVPRQGKVSTESARTMFVALPDSCPHVYISVTGAASLKAQEGVSSSNKYARIDVAATKKIVLEAIPKALSRPQQRWSLETTKLATKSLRAMTLLRGSGKVGATGGILSQLTLAKPESEAVKAAYEEPNGEAEQLPAEHQRMVTQRFGSMKGPLHAKLDRVQVRVQNLVAIPSQKGKKRQRVADDRSEETDCTPATITLSGTDVFAGLKEFALRYPGYVNVQRLPAVLTGEQSITALGL